jgi:hypothetical protein
MRARYAAGRRCNVARTTLIRERRFPIQIVDRSPSVSRAERNVGDLVTFLSPTHKVETRSAVAVT